MTEIEQAIEILRRTNDGDDLAPHHLYLIQIVVNGGLYDVTEEAEVAFQKLYDDVVNSVYVKPWMCGVENLTQDHEGYVYWKGVEVEHYSHSDYEKKKADAEELARRCRSLEERGIEVNTRTAVWRWQEEYSDDAINED